MLKIVLSKLVHTPLYIVIVVFKINPKTSSFMKSRLILQVLCLLLCASPSLYGQFPVNCIDYAIVYGPGGASEVVTCEGDGIAETYNFGTSTLAMPFGFLITDENDIILKVSIDNTLSFEGLGLGSFKVYAFSFIGQVTAQPGQNATTTQLGSICGALTTNFIPITNFVPDGGNIATSDGNTSQFVCPDDNVDDTIQFMTTGDQSVSYAYLITDENNIIQDIANGDSYDFGSSPVGTYRVWGVSYAGNLTAMIGDDAAVVPLSDDCFGLSANFIEVTVSQPDGATVSLANGETEATVCVADGQADILSFINQSTASSAYVYLVTDEDNTILAVVNGDNFDFEPAAPGNCRVWGVSYTGAFTAVAGDDAASDDLSDGCFDLSDNFIEVVRQAAIGGMVSIEGGATEGFACIGDGIADEFTFVNNSTSADNYVYLITDEDNIILEINTDGIADFEGADIGICRVWGLAYGGNLLAQVGDDAAAVILADGCFGRSDNFVTIRRESVEGGTVAMPNGNTLRYTCPGDGNADVVEFTNTGSSTGEYIYVITDENLIILDVTTDSSFDFDAAPAGNCLVWGLAYTGNLTAAIGDNASAVSLSDECFDLSDNVITVVRETPEGGTVAMPNGNTIRYTCPNDGMADIVMFDSTGTSSGPYAYVITDENNVILDFPTGDSFDFDSAPAGTCRVWGLAYTGNVTVAVGDTASAVALTDDCFDLSDNFITVVRETPEGGTVAMPNGGTTIYTCPGDGMADIVMFDSTGTSSGPYAYVITDEDNVILDFATGDSYDFDAAPAGTCRVWGLAYTGNVTVAVGDTASAVALTDDCFDLSDNFITVIRQLPDGGTVSFSDGSNLQFTCPGDGNADELTFEAVDTVGPSFTYVITDEQNIVLALAPDASFDFDAAPEGICRVWGLAYNGNLIAMVGDTASTATLADDCFDLSDNFLAVVRQVPIGGTVSTSDGETTVYTCPGDGTADIISFDSAGVTITPYAYVITDENNVILDFPAGDSFDFDTAPEGICRVWGLAYTGNVTAVVGDTASVVALTDDCFELSSNFITVIRSFPDAGQVAIEDGTTEAFLCSDSGANGTIEFDSLQTSNTPYVYLVTDTNNIILDIVDTDSYNFVGLAEGTYRVWGLAYTGNLLATVGSSAENNPLSDDCFDLSDNIILVINQPTDGGVVDTENDPSLTICPGDGNPDIIEFSNTGIGANYVYVVTDESNIIITTTDQNSIDFDIAGIGISRVWGLAYTGNLTANAGDNAAAIDLSDDCFDLSDNFITVVREVPEAGTIATEDGETIVYTCPGDGNDDIITVDSSGVTGAFTYVITDDNNVILEVPDGDSFNFDDAPEGVCRIWGLAYSGNLIAAVGDTASLISLSDDCFDLSDNFVTVVRMLPDGGTINTITGGDTISICPNDGIADLIELDSSGTIGNYQYLLADENDILISFIDGDKIDFDTLPEGVYRIWGQAYTGNVIATGSGGFVYDCQDFSDNFITIINQSPEAGSITSQLGSIAEICVGDGVSDVIEFLVTGAGSGEYVYLITDSSGVLVSALADASFDFNNIVPDEYRVYGLAYTGLPNLTPGDNINDVDLSNDCFDLTDNFITISTTGVDGAIIYTSEGVGEDILYLCVGDGVPNELTFFNTTSATDASFAFAITNETNIVIGFLPPNNTFDFEIAGAGIANVIGISYTGNLLIGLGQNIFDTVISDGCYDLSENIISIIRDLPESGLITTLDGETDILICGDEQLFVSSTNTATTGIAYLLTDTDNIVIEVIENLPIDFAQLPLGEYRIWELAYTGFLNDFIGEDAATTVLATSCYELSQNFIAVSQGPGVDGGAVSTFFDQDVFFTCSNDDVFDIIPMTTTSADTTYTYIITDGNDNVIVSDVEESVIPFEGAADGVYHIWGLSYYGDLLYNFGDNVLTTPASDSCFALSENFVTVVRETPEGGTILTNEGADAVTAIVGDSIPDEFTFISLDASEFLPYLYVVTDTNNVILDVSISPVIDFEGADPGVCRVWGLAYAGNLTAMIGDDADEVALADDCFSLTSNFVTVTRVDAGFQDGEEETLAVGDEVIQQFKIAPNPATNFTVISFELSQLAQPVSTLQVLDGRGQLVEITQIASRAGQNQHELAISNWSGGMYVAFIRNGSEVQAKKFIVIQE
jgi:ribose 5-phosphate isomerase